MTAEEISASYYDVVTRVCVLQCDWPVGAVACVAASDV